MTVATVFAGCYTSFYLYAITVVMMSDYQWHYHCYQAYCMAFRLAIVNVSSADHNQVVNSRDLNPNSDHDIAFPSH